MQPELIAMLVVFFIILVWIVSSIGNNSGDSQDDTSDKEQDANSSVGSGRKESKVEDSDKINASSTEIWSRDSTPDNQPLSVTEKKSIECPQCGDRCDLKTEFCGNCGSGLQKDMIYLYCCENLLKIPYQEPIGGRLRDFVIADGESEFEAKKISREHIRFVESEGSVYVIDLDSEHGTTLNGSPLKPNRRHEVSRGDFLQIASTTEIKIRST